jgi:hypothetical protein
MAEICSEFDMIMVLNFQIEINRLLSEDILHSQDSYVRKQHRLSVQ